MHPSIDKNLLPLLSIVILKGSCGPTFKPPNPTASPTNRKGI